MTSRPAVDALLRELRFDGGAPPAGSDRTARFAFGLDFDSAERWPDVPYDTAAASAFHDGASRARVAAILDDAAATLARQVPSALRLADAQLERVLLRSSDALAGGSASHRAHVGRCLLTNLDRPANAQLLAIEAVTHESIHQRLYRLEAADGLFCDLDATPTFRSPWTGARLPRHSLIHAAFVWFGLLNLWTVFARTATTDDETSHARGRIAHCLFGFAFLDELVASPSFPPASVATAVREGLRDMAAAAPRAARMADAGTTLRQVAAARSAAAWPAAVDAGLKHAPG